jgi:cystathionine beta-lyase/cystathionine gamma-synthase
MVANPHGHMVRRTEPQALETSKLSIAETWSVLLGRLKEGTALIKSRFEERARIEQDIAARKDEWCNSIFVQQFARLEQLTAELEMQLAITQNLQSEGQSSGKQVALTALSTFTLTPWQMEERFRALIQMQSFVGSFFERASPGYDQSRTLWWFDPAFNGANGLNYDRYGATDVQIIEERLLKALGMGDTTNNPIKLLLTSSGVSAFTCLNQFVMSKVLKAGDTIVLSPYLYFESFDHLRPVSHVKVVNSATFDAEDIIETAERHNARVVYLDPMANTIGLETTDLRKFAQLVSGRPGWSDRYLLMDGTLISGGLPLYDWFNEPSHPKILYYESAHKYIQMGMDIVMCGLLVYPAEFHQDLGLIRQITGTTLYSRQANVLPAIDAKVHQSRMYWLTSNAERLYHILDKQASQIAGFNYPLHWRKMGWGHGGNVVTIKLFGDDQINKRPSLDRFIELVLRAGEEEDVGMTKGGGLGFSATRIWPSTPFIRNEDPYIRISVGIDANEVEPVARAIIKALDRHYRASRSVMAQWRLKENGTVNSNGNGLVHGNGNGLVHSNGNGNGAVYNNGNGGIKQSAHFGKLV